MVCVKQQVARYSTYATIPRIMTVDAIFFRLVSSLTNLVLIIFQLRFCQEKVTAARDRMRSEDADFLLLSMLDEVACKREHMLLV